MKYTIRWLESDGNPYKQERDDYAAAVKLAKCLDDWFCGVEVLDETGRPVWPFCPDSQRR